MRLHVLNRLVRSSALVALVIATGLASTRRAPPASAEDFVPPDLTRFMATWLWAESQGIVTISNPETKGATRTLELHPDLTYEFHQCQGTRDSILCKGIFSVGESSENATGEVVTTLDFDGWYEPYEKRMVAAFEGPDTLDLAGVPCVSCPQHMFVRGKSALFGTAVKRGESYRHELWDGLSFELRPKPSGWEMALVDSAMPKENQIQMTLSGALQQIPRVLEGEQFREGAAPKTKGKAQAEEPWLNSRRFVFSRGPMKQDSTAYGDREPQPGRGLFTVEQVKLARAAGSQGAIESMRFKVLIQEARGALSRP